MNSVPSNETLRREQEFFDREAAELLQTDLRIAPHQVKRYCQARIRPANIPKETLFALLGSLEGKKVLDYGCGHGENACLFAACGAQVTAFDLSPGSIAVGQQRAEVMGLADRIDFSTRAAGDTGYDADSFDIICGEAILHHLHMDLDTIYAEIDRLLKPHGQACFIEPVANSAVMRGLRRITPVPYETTPDERQMTYADFELMQPYFSSLEFHHFYCLERLQRLLPAASRFRLRGRMRRLDYAAQNLFPVLRSFYGTLLVVAKR